MLRDFLRTPSSFPDDPRGFAFNQAGHAGVGMLFAWYFGPWSLIAIAFIYAAIEVHQWRVDGGEDWDCVQDWCFVMTGAVAASVVPLVPWPVTAAQFAVLAAWLLAGYLRRADAG